MININFSQRTLSILTGIVFLITLVTMAYFLWQWRSDWQLTHHEISTATFTQLTANTDQSKKLIAAIANRHLFGQAVVGDVPLTNLQLHVTGIVKSMLEHSKSKAYISIAGQPSKIFQIGDNLPYGVKIYDITAQAVIVENNGHLEKILLPREKLQFKTRQEEEPL